MRQDTIISIYSGNKLLREQACYYDGDMTHDFVWSFIRDTNPTLPPDCTYTLRQVNDAKQIAIRPLDYTIEIGDKVIPVKACPSCQTNLWRNPQDIQNLKCAHCGQHLEESKGGESQ